MLDRVGLLVRAAATRIGHPGPETEPQPLDGGITNRNFKVETDRGAWVVRLPGAETELLGIDREAERDANELGARLGIAPEVAHWNADPAGLVTRFVEGETMSPDALRAPEAIHAVAASLRDLHDSGGRLGSRFDVVEIAADYARVAAERGIDPPPELEPALRTAHRIRDLLGTHGDHAPVPCHNDLLAANFIAAERGIVIVDWEYAGMGDRYFDLANFAVNNELGAAERELLLRAYIDSGETELDAVGLERRGTELTLMTYMSDLREAMWGLLQGAISEIEFDFRAYCSEHFERLERTASGPEFVAAIEASS